MLHVILISKTILWIINFVWFEYSVVSNILIYIYNCLSDAYIANQINVTWFSFEPIRYNPEIGLPEFTITGITHDYCDGTYNYAITEEDYKTGSQCIML